MAEAKKEYLYSVYQGPMGNEALKEKAREIGAELKFDREVGAYELKTDGLAKKDVANLKAQLGDFIGKEAKGRWEAERSAFQASKGAVAAEVKARESTTAEPKPEKAPVVDSGAIVMYPALSQKKAFKDLVLETQSVSRFQKARDGELPYFSVQTSNPEKFVEYVGEAAKERFQTEYAEHVAKGGKMPEQNVDINTPVEKARDAARARAGSAFMAQYKDRGFMLGDPGRDAANHQRQLNDMTSATSSQLLAVIKQSRAILEPLREKEVKMRADAAGLPVEQIKAMSFADQKKIVDAAGNSVGLTGDDFQKNVALSRGISAIDTELKGRRGIGQEKGDREQSREQSQGQGNAQGKAAERAPAHSVSEENSVDSDFATLAAGFQRQRGNRGR